MIPQRFKDWPVWPVFLAWILTVYAAQLIMAGSLESHAAATTANSLPPSMYMVLAPWLHSFHMHILQNALFFGVFGYWVEKRIDRDQFTVYVVSAGYLTLYLPIAFDFGGLSVGVSGVNKGLIMFFVAYHFAKCMAAADRNAEIKKIGYHFAVFFLPFIFWVLVTAARFLGHVSPPRGTSVSAHLAGLMYGGLWYIYWSYSNGSRPVVRERDLA